MTRGGGGGKEEEGKVMGPLFPRLHVNDAGRGGGPRAPPRNKMALYEQFTVPSNRFSSSASTRGGGTTSLVPSTSASRVYGYDMPLFQPFDVPSNEPARSSEKINANSISGQVNSTRKESGMLSSQTKSKDIHAAASIAGCSSQHRADNEIRNSSGKKLTNDDEFMVPSILYSRFPQHSTQEHAGIQEKLTPLCTTSPYKSLHTVSKSSTKCHIAVNKQLEKIDVSDVRSKSSPKVEKEPAQVSKNVEVEAKKSSVQGSKDKFGNKDSKVCSKRDKTGSMNNSDKPHLGNSEYQVTGRNGGSMKMQNPPMARNAVSSKPCANIDNTERNSNLLEGGLRETCAKRKRSVAHHDAEQNDDLFDSSVKCIPGWEISPDEIVGAIGPKHFWKARRAILNQQRVFAVQVFELHKLIKVQKLIAASPHLLIEDDPCLGNALVGSKNKLAEGNLKTQPLSITNKDDMQPTLEQPELSKENTEENPPSPSRGDGLGGGHHDHAATNGAFTSNLPAMPVAPDNKQNNWRVHPPQNQWLVPVMSPSEGLVYKPYAGPCPPAGSLLPPFYANCTPLRLPSTAYGVPMPHQPQHMGPLGTPAMPMNYFPPFSLPVMNPVAVASSVEQGSHLAASQPNGHVEQHSRISGNMSHPSGIWRFHASRDSEPQASSASSPFDRLQGDGSGPVSLFPTASVQNAQPQLSSGSRDNQTHVIRVVPHNSQTASVSAARIFRSIQKERQRNHS